MVDGRSLAVLYMQCTHVMIMECEYRDLGAERGCILAGGGLDSGTAVWSLYEIYDIRVFLVNALPLMHH